MHVEDDGFITLVPDLSHVGSIIALTQCAECPQTIPQNFAITGKYFGDVEHFCSLRCQDAYEVRLNEQALEKLREAGL